MTAPQQGRQAQQQPARGLTFSGDRQKEDQTGFSENEEVRVDPQQWSGNSVLAMPLASSLQFSGTHYCCTSGFGPSLSLKVCSPSQAWVEPGEAGRNTHSTDAQRSVSRAVMNLWRKLRIHLSVPVSCLHNLVGTLESVLHSPLRTSVTLPASVLYFLYYCLSASVFHSRYSTLLYCCSTLFLREKPFFRRVSTHRHNLSGLLKINRCRICPVV